MGRCCIILKLTIAAAFLIILLFNLKADITRNQKLKLLTKPLLIPLIILFYLINTTHINRYIVTALFFGFIGDFFLLWEQKKLSFMIGLLAFFTGHLFYTVVFLEATHFYILVPSWFFLLLIPYIIYGLFILKLLKPGLKNMTIPVIIYMCAILIMSFTSACRILNGFTPQYILPFIGSLFFIVSDSVLAYNSFIAPSKNYEAFIMATYIMAQSLIVAGFLS